MKKIAPEKILELRNMLFNIGLDEKESDVYLALLTTKTSSVSALSKIIDCKRTTLYFILDRLCEKGFVSLVKRGNVRNYVAEPPEKLIAHTQERQQNFRRIEQQLNNALPLFQSLTSDDANTPHVKMLHGMEGLKQTYLEILPHEFLGMVNPEIMYQAFGMLAPHLLFDGGLDLRGRDLVTNGPHIQRYVKELPVTEHYDYRILPEGITFDCDVIIWDNKVALFSYDAQHTIIQIENEQIHNMFKSWFEGFWKISSPHQNI